MLRPWVPNLIVRAEGRGSLSLRIAQAIIEEIQRGRLAAGDSLPGTRDLARDLSVNRKTVVQAYEELNAQGWVTTDMRRGTFVARSIGERQRAARIREPANPASPSPRGREVRPPLLWPPQGKVRFDDGAPDQRLIPATAIAQAYASARARRRRASACSAMAIRAAPRLLRQSISKMLNMTRGLNTTPDNICVTRGSQMALYVIAQCLVAARRHGDLRGTDLSAGGAGLHARRRAHVQAARLDPGRHRSRSSRRHLPAHARARRLSDARPPISDDRRAAPERAAATARARRAIRLRRRRGRLRPRIPVRSSADVPAGEQRPHAGRSSMSARSRKILSPEPARRLYRRAQAASIEQIGNWIGTIDRQGDPITELAIVELIESGQLRRHIKRVHAIFDKRRMAFADMRCVPSSVAWRASKCRPAASPSGCAFRMRLDFAELERRPAACNF